MKRKKLLQAFIAAILLSVYCCSSISATITHEMGEIANSLQNIYPILLNKEPFGKHNKEFLLNNLQHMQQHLQHVDDYKHTTPITFTIAYDLLEEQLATSIKALKANKFDYAKFLLKSIPTGCVNCHTQYRGLNVKVTELAKKDNYNEFEIAEYYFLTRNYLLAQNLYEKVLQVPQPSTVLETSIKRILTIDLNFLKDITSAQNSLQEIMEHNAANLDSNLIAKIIDWQQGLNSLALQKDKFNNLTSIEAIRDIINNHNPSLITVSREDQVFYLYLYGYIFDYLNTLTVDTDVPELLYYLAICDKAIEYNYLPSISDHYLQQCVKKYPDNPFATKCLSEYEDYINFAYSGSGGKFIPTELAKEIKLLHKVIKK